MSDERLKQNIRDADTPGKAAIASLRVRDFDGMYTISWTNLIPHLIKHNQDQQAEIDALVIRVRELEDQ